MKLLIILLAMLWAVSAQGEALNLEWDKVTLDADGNPLDTNKIIYKLYRRIPTGTWKLVASRIGTWYTWYYPVEGHYIYRVTAINEYGESEPSNELKIFVDACPIVEN